MMKYRLINSKEKSIWNKFVLNSPRSHIFQSYEWGEAMSHLGWEPFRLIVEDGKHIRACISVLRKHILLTPWSILYSPRGPILDFKNLEAFDCLMQGIIKIASSQRSIFLQIIPHAFVEDRGTADSLSKEGFVKIEKQGLFRITQPLWVYRIDLSKTEQELLSQMKIKSRYNVRLAIRKGVEVSQRNSLDDLVIFYKMLRRTSARKNFAIRGFSYFSTIWKEMATHGLAELFFATYQDRILAGALVFVFGKICWYMYGASETIYSNVRPNYALQWHIIKWAKEKGCLWYDLRGVASFNPSPNHSGYGVYKFKKGFGGQPFTFLGDYYYIFKPNLYKHWERGEILLNRGGKLLLRFYRGS